jgi:hypothetical protein
MTTNKRVTTPQNERIVCLKFEVVYLFCGLKTKKPALSFYAGFTSWFVKLDYAFTLSVVFWFVSFQY